METDNLFRKQRILALRGQLTGFEVVSILKQLGASNAKAGKLLGISPNRISRYANKASVVAELNMLEARAARADPCWPYE